MTRLVTWWWLILSTWLNREIPRPSVKHTSGCAWESIPRSIWSQGLWPLCRAPSLLSSQPDGVVVNYTEKYELGPGWRKWVTGGVSSRTLSCTGLFQYSCPLRFPSAMMWTSLPRHTLLTMKCETINQLLPSSWLGQCLTMSVIKLAGGLIACVMSSG